MNDTAPQDDTRQRILAAAEEHFRILGYSKTTVADIAKACGMSSANVYRFFDSKAAINETIADIWLSELAAQAVKIAQSDETASDRLKALILDNLRTIRDRYTDENRVHEMVSVAMEQQWHVVARHLAAMRRIYQQVIEDGNARGEFHVADPEKTAGFVQCAVVKFCHPSLVAQSFGDPLEEKADGVVGLLVGGMRAGFG